jgi:hypothetical protein
MVKRRGQSAAFMARIRKLRGKKKVIHTRIKSHGRYKNMAKRRVKKSRKYGKSSGVMGGIVGTGLGVGAYILFESMIEPKLLAMANVSNPLIVNAGELVLGMYLAKKGGILGNVGKAAIVINLYQILHPYLSTLGNGSAVAQPLNFFS